MKQIVIVCENCGKILTPINPNATEAEYVPRGLCAECASQAPQRQQTQQDARGNNTADTVI